MVRISNAVLGFLNMITLLAGLAAIGAGLYFMIGPNTAVTACEKGIDKPLLYVGIALFVVSLLGLVGSCCRVNLVLYVYLTCMFLLILGFIAFAIIAFLVTNESVGHVTSKTKATDFQGRLWNHLVGSKNWDGIKSCLIDSEVCKNVVGGGGGGDLKLAEFYQKNLSPLQSGCCSPPASCGFQAKNATFWVAPKTGAASKDADCTKWSNQQQALCYDCDSCKNGFVNNVKHKWKAITIVSVAALIICIFVYVVGCCAKSNNSRGSKHNRFRGYGGYQYAA